MNLLRERAGASDMAPWLDIYDDDLEAALAAYETVNEEEPPTDKAGGGAKLMGRNLVGSV
jgi:hypothetical protein